MLLLLILAASLVYFAPLAAVDARTRFTLWRFGVQSHYTQAGPYRLHYFEAKPPQSPGRPLLLIHGLGSRGEDWAPLIPGFAAAGFQVYALDLPGFGRSPRPDADYSIHFQTEAVTSFMEAVHLTHADVIGWSMGGWVAAQLTLAHPKLVDRLALYDAAGIYFPRTFDANLFLPTDPAGLARLGAMLSPHPRAIPTFIARNAIARLQDNRLVTGRAVAAMLNGRELLDFQVHRIHQPTLLVWGKLDRLIPVATAAILHREIAGSVLVEVDGCGHLAPGECTAPVLRETIAFLQADPPPARAERTVSSR